MNQIRTMKVRESTAETIAWVIDANGKAKDQIRTYILENGIKAFLLSHYELELDAITHEKIKVLKRVLKTFDGDIETINFGDMDEGC